LLFAPFLVAVIAPVGQGVLIAFQVTGGHIVQKKLGLALAPVKGEQPLFDTLLCI
jgi:hypothetical protein